MDEEEEGLERYEDAVGWEGGAVSVDGVGDGAQGEGAV